MIVSGNLFLILTPNQTLSNLILQKQKLGQLSRKKELEFTLLGNCFSGLIYELPHEMPNELRFRILGN